MPAFDASEPPFADARAPAKISWRVFVPAFVPALAPILMLLMLASAKLLVVEALQIAGRWHSNVGH